MKNLWLSAVCLLVVISHLAGCGTSYPRASSDTTKDASSEYFIGPELSMQVPVRPDGKITTPLVEDLQASGKTPTELAREIEKRIAKYIQSPVVTVVVTSFVGPYSQQIRVIGEATKPQALPYRENMTLLDVMIAVGGITDFAAGNKASILRTVGGKKEQFGVRLHALLKRGDVAENIPMRAGDVLIIPQSIF
jgi:polysaccharide export outer membrane protein